MNILTDELVLTLTYDEYKKYTKGNFTDPAFKAFDRNWYIVEAWVEHINTLLHKDSCQYYAKFQTFG